MNAIAKVVVPVFRGRLRGQRWVVRSSVHCRWLYACELGKVSRSLPQ
jgi:hypothetical protein